MTSNEARAALEAHYKAINIWPQLLAVIVSIDYPGALEVLARPMATTTAFRVPEAMPGAGYDSFRVVLSRFGVLLSDSAATPPAAPAPSAA
jgi:hypothetical protein